jgi:3-oxoacyl-[acyl-carrier-protein] synthase II
MKNTRREPHQRVVITGMGAVTPVGNTAPETWEALKAGRSGIRRIDSEFFDPTPWACQVHGTLQDFNPRQFIPHKKMRHMAFASQIAVVAAGEALRDSGLDLEQQDLDRFGVAIGTAGGSCIEETESTVLQRVEGAKRLSPFQSVRLWPNMAAYYVAETFDLRGYNTTVSTACASSTQAIGEAAEIIRRGAANVMFAGGSESMASETMLVAFIAMRALSTGYNDEPERAMRPFDKDRDGFVASQGGAMFVLESLERAQERGARIYAEILGYGVSNDAYHMIVPDPEGLGAALAVRQALESAGVSIEDVDHISSHGTGTILGDVAETQVIKAVFGKRAYDIPINSTKSMVGHMMGATGAVEALACAMSIQEGIIHPTINLDNPDPECDLDYVPQVARRAKVNVAVSNSFGLGGQNAVLVLGTC